MITKHISDDLDLRLIAESGQCFRWNMMPDGSYRIIAGGKCLYAGALGDGLFGFECTEEEFEYLWSVYLDLGEDYGSIRARIKKDEDPFLYEASEYEKGIRILRQDPWEMLITFIISQNRNIPAIQRSVELICEFCGEKKSDTRGDAYYSFPDPESLALLTEDRLKECRLGYRCAYVHEAASAVAEGRFDIGQLLDADEETTIRELTGLYGVGRKVANCVSLFGLHHINAFPVDVWVKRILEEKYPDGYPFERYSPYNGICQQYMFAYYRHIASRDGK